VWIKDKGSRITKKGEHVDKKREILKSISGLEDIAGNLRKCVLNSEEKDEYSAIMAMIIDSTNELIESISIPLSLIEEEVKEEDEG
jgi:hypothetical protein